MKAFLVSMFFVLFSAAAFAAVEADNSGLNKKDQKSDYALTADKQSNSQSDIRISSEIRKSILSDDSLSTYAHNVKIITIDGQVTLKGPVQSKAERKIINKKAKTVAGVSKVIDQTNIIRKE